MDTKTVWLVENQSILIPQAAWCASFGSKLRGFTFRRHLGEQDGLVLVEKSESRLNTAIHMLFVFFDLGVIWVDAQGVIVGKALAKPWRLSYTPPQPAQYVIEGHPSILQQVQIGHHVEFRKQGNLPPT